MYDTYDGLIPNWNYLLNILYSVHSFCQRVPRLELGVRGYIL